MSGEIYASAVLNARSISGATSRLERRTIKFKPISREKEPTGPTTPEEAVENLSKEEKMLIINVHDPELNYNHSWSRYNKELTERQKRRPYIFKMFNRMEQDQERIERIEVLERKFSMRFYNARANYRR